MRILSTLFLLALTLSASSQLNSLEINLQSGKFALEPTSNNNLELVEIATWPTFNNQRYGVISLEQYPTTEEWELLQESGIRNISFVPNKAFIVSIASGANLIALNQFGVVGQSGFLDSFKGSKTQSAPPARALSVDGVVANLHIFDGVNWGSALASIADAGAEIIEEEQAMNYVVVSAEQLNINAIKSLPFVQFVDWKYDAGAPENYTSRTLARTNFISPENTNGIGYDGSGIAVALQDDGNIGPHIDHHGRILEQFWAGSLGDHGDHVGGTINGAGNLNPYHEGQAKGSDLYVYKAAPEYQAYDSMYIHYNSKNVVITSTSYSNGCNAGYTALARTMDQQIHDMKSLIHVFSAGNSGTSNCGYGAGNTWGNITGGHKVGKNTMTVANLDHEDNLATSSSRGPAHDGRIKPDISAKGSSVTSTIDGNTYGVKSGTSMSCPAVSGTLAVLYEAFEDQQGAMPASGLIKAIALNTAEDLGNVGPDFKYGWGRINARRAYEVIESTSFTSGTIANGDSSEFTIAVPSNTASAKFMLYWTDPEASVNASTALINDLDITVTDPSSNVLLPYVLNSAANASTLDNPATPGIDHLNNMEQVEITSPSSGNYQVKVKGFNIPQGPQEFFIVYWFEPEELVLTYPVGGESFVPFNTEKIRWDSPYTSGTANVEYSANGGSTWSSINANVPVSQGYVDWTVPNLATGNIQVRITHGSQVSQSDDLSIIRTPTGLTVDYACPDSIGLSWNNTSGATEYTVHRLGQKYMEAWGTSTSLEFVDYNSNPYSENLWYSVSSLGNNDAVGKRAVAIQHTGGIYNCLINDDAGLISMSPSSGNVFDCHGDSMALSFEVQNFGSNSITSIDADVTSTNGQSFSETFTVNIAPNATTELSFAQKLAFGSSQQIAELVIDITNDGNSYNDTLRSTYLPNSAPTLDAIWSEDFETFTQCGTESDCGATVCEMENNWKNQPNGLADIHDWRTNSGGTPSQFTGPTADHTFGTAQGNYLYLEASGGCNASAAELISPCIDLIGLSEATLTFWYHMNGADMGILALDVYDGNSWTNDVFIEAGDQGNNWLEATVALDDFTDNIINLRFRGITSSDFRGDMAIDDIGVSAPPVANFNFEVQNDYQSVAFTDLSLLGDTMSFDLGDNTILDSVPPLYTYGDTLVYEVTQIVSNDYGSDTASQLITTLNIDQIRTQLKVYPNPAIDFVVIESSKSILSQISVYDINGRLLQTLNPSSAKRAQVDVSAYSTGSYILRIGDSKAIEFTVVR